MTARAASLPLAQLPNALTVLRFALVPVFVVLFIQSDGGQSWPAAIVFALAAITDQLDGWLARRLQVESTFGKYADPLADRLMIDAAVVLLVVEGRLPWLALVLVVARDALLVGGTRLAVSRGYVFSVNLLGKIATWLLYASIAFVLVTPDGTRWPLLIFWSGVVLAVGAAVAYVASAWKVLHT